MYVCMHGMEFVSGFFKRTAVGTIQMRLSVWHVLNFMYIPFVVFVFIDLNVIFFLNFFFFYELNCEKL